MAPAVRRLRDRATDVLQEAAGLIKYRLGSGPWPKPIFVLGTGRSGTTWVGEILDRHPDIAASIERPRFFVLSRDIALTGARRGPAFDRLVSLYRYEIARVAPRHFVDKSHTNIWIADLLAEELPDAVFVGVHRSVHGTVASMLRHRGVQRWAENWRRYPLPNLFLGIGADEGDSYDSLGVAGRSVLRWVSHERRFAELRRVLGERLVEIRYEQLHVAPRDELRRVERAAGLRSPIPEPTPKTESLDRWRTELTEAQVAEIDSIVTLKLGHEPTSAAREESELAVPAWLSR